MRRYRGSVFRDRAEVFIPVESAALVAAPALAATEIPAAAPLEHLVKLSNEVAGIGVAVFDAQVRFVEINPALAVLNGLPEQAHLGRPLADIVPELGATLADLAHRALEQRDSVKDQKFTARVPFGHGPVREWLASFFPIDFGGGVAGVAETLIEVTGHMRLEAALADLALDPRGAALPGVLTVREADVLALIGYGKTTKEIAALLGISVETVGNHRKQLCRKLNLHSTAELAAYAATIAAGSPVWGNPR